MNEKISTILLPVLAGTLRILLAAQIIVFTTPIMMAAASNLYIVIGFYALQHALNSLKQLSKQEQQKHTLFFGGCCILFISRGITDLYRYLSPIYGFHINTTFLLQPTTSYPPLLEMFANNLPIISLSILTALTMYHLFNAKPTACRSSYHKLLSVLDMLFIGVCALLCLTHVYASLALFFSSGYYATVVTPYSAISISHTLSGFYEPLASMVLFAPRLNTSEADFQNKSGTVPSPQRVASLI